MREAIINVDMCYDFVDDNGRLTVGKPAQAVVPYQIEQQDRVIGVGGVVAYAIDHHIKGIDGNWPPHCDPETNGVEPWGPLKSWYEDRKARDTVRIFPKSTYNAFWGTDYLAKWLRRYEVDTVSLVGVCTDICIFNTAAGAYFSGFKVRVLKRGCATLQALQGNEQQVYEMMKGQFFAEIVE